jgi:hypothetical protein
MGSDGVDRRSCLTCCLKLILLYSTVSSYVSIRAGSSKGNVLERNIMNNITLVKIAFELDKRNEPRRRSNRL